MSLSIWRVVFLVLSGQEGLMPTRLLEPSFCTIYHNEDVEADHVCTGITTPMAHWKKDSTSSDEQSTKSRRGLSFHQGATRSRWLTRMVFARLRCRFPHCFAGIGVSVRVALWWFWSRFVINESDSLSSFAVSRGYPSQCLLSWRSLSTG